MKLLIELSLLSVKNFLLPLFVKKNRRKKKKKGKYIYFCINTTHNSSMNINN